MTNDLTLTGIPTEIPWSRVKAFLQDELGINLNEVVARTGIQINWNSIECDIFALNKEGRRFLANGDGVATNHVHINITHDEESNG